MNWSKVSDDITITLPAEITGNPTVGFREEDFEKDFDPAHYDALMERVFDEQWYEEGEEGGKKPSFSDSEEEEGEGCGAESKPIIFFPSSFRGGLGPLASWGGGRG